MKRWQFLVWMFLLFAGTLSSVAAAGYRAGYQKGVKTIPAPVVKVARVYHVCP